MTEVKSINNKRYIIYRRIGKIMLYIALTLLALFFLMPVLFLILNSFKGHSEIIRGPLSIPESLNFDFIASAFDSIHFPRALGVTVLLTMGSLLFIVIISALVGWIITRYKSKKSTVIYLVFVAAMLVPFQAVMYPLLNLFGTLSLKNLLGLGIMYVGFGMSMSVFLYCGFFKSVPLSIEEAALIDGASIFQIFFRIVFPLVRSTTVTVLILNGMWIWNDYLLPFMTLGTSETKTLVLELYYSKMLSGQFGNPWELIFPAVLISVLPMVIVFLLLQKQFAKGVSDGAIKT